MTESKDHAGIKIPAPILTIIHITMAILLGLLAPLPIPAPPFVIWLGLGLAALGFILGVLALIEFRRARTTSDPKRPTQNIVTSGIYRYTRNPIYLGFVFILIGLPSQHGNLLGLHSCLASGYIYEQHGHQTRRSLFGEKIQRAIHRLQVTGETLVVN